MISALRTAITNRLARRRTALATRRAAWAADLDAPGARRGAWADMTFRDHGLIRALWSNRREIAPGVWRSNQPSPAQVAGLARLGIRTILNFRGASHWGSYTLEKEACARNNITLVDTRLYSNRAPRRDEILTVLGQMQAAERPMLMHCKSGADRAALASALYLLANGHDPADAAAQFSWKHAHFRASRTGILDAFVATYAKAHAATGIGFLDWVETVYDPQDLTRRFQQSRAGNRLLDWVLRRE